MNTAAILLILAGLLLWFGSVVWAIGGVAGDPVVLRTGETGLRWCRRAGVLGLTVEVAGILLAVVA